VKYRLGAAALALVSGWTGAAHATPPACSERLLPPSPRAGTGQRVVSARDLIELRDFGRLDDSIGSTSFRLSPDGKHAALIIRRADTDTDSYCLGVVLVTLDGSAAPRLLDVGGQLILNKTDPYGASGVPSGLPLTDAPVWSPNGKSLAYLRRDQDSTQIWRVGLDGQQARQLTRLTTEPRNLAWSSDGRYLLYSTRRGYDAGLAQIEREARSGFLYDDRFWPLAFDRPHPKTPIATETNAFDLATRATRVVTLAEAEVMLGSGESAAPANARLFVASLAGSRAWVADEDPVRPRGGTLLRIDSGNTLFACNVPFCREAVGGLWWLDSKTLLILRSGNVLNGGRTALYRWRPGSVTMPKLLLETEDWLPRCELTSGALICARESATRPRTLARIDLASGRSTTVFDANPEFGELRLGSHQRLAWSDRDGVHTYGDLVLPPAHKVGDRHPLIIVQYLSRGFQRGGLGDEYPIQLLASRGYAVLNFNAPKESPEAAAERDDVAAQRIKVRNWAGRRRILTALEAGIEAAIATGVVDPDVIGITGMSDGASTVQFALNNTSRFKAAIVSNCCDEPSAIFTVAPAYGAAVAAVGYPAAGEDGRDFWRAQSLSRNAGRIRVPLLMNLADGEFRMALETFSALKAHGAPVEIYVFEDEWHTKHHPAHRLAIYERNLAWFDFWLRDIEATDPERAPEIARWKAMRSAPGGGVR
jgi:dipeptidyl aminopeptidase/acylaminoacyl peptidase